MTRVNEPKTKRDFSRYNFVTCAALLIVGSIMASKFRWPIFDPTSVIGMITIFLAAIAFFLPILVKKIVIPFVIISSLSFTALVTLTASRSGTPLNETSQVTLLIVFIVSSALAQILGRRKMAG